MKLPFTLKQLLIIKAVALKKNLTNASKILLISQPTLSKQIQKLENNLGILLFNRENNIITLTDAGRTFLNYSERILSLCEESCRNLNDLKKGYRGNLNIASTNQTTNFLLPRILTLFIKRFPQFNIKIYISSKENILTYLINENIDIALIHSYKLIKKKYIFNIDNLLSDEIFLAIRKKYIYKKKRLNKKNILLLNFISLRSNFTFYQFLKQKLLQNNIKNFKLIVQTNSRKGLKRATILGIGVSFISSKFISRNLKINFTNLEKIKIIRTFYSVTNQKSNNFRMSKVFIKELNKLINISKQLTITL